MPDGNVLIEGRRLNSPCSDGTRYNTGFYHYSPYFQAEYTSTTIKLGGTNFRFEATLTDPTTLSGTTWTPDRIIQRGVPVCSLGEVSFPATFRGTGKNVLVQEYLATGVTMTPEVALQRFDIFCKSCGAAWDSAP